MGLLKLHCVLQALMQKRVRNFEAKGLFESDDVAVDEEDHWLLKQLASAAGADAPVDVKQLMLDPSKGAAELVHSMSLKVHDLSSSLGFLIF